MTETYCSNAAPVEGLVLAGESGKSLQRLFQGKIAGIPVSRSEIGKGVGEKSVARSWIIGPFDVDAAVFRARLLKRTRLFMRPCETERIGGRSRRRGGEFRRLDCRPHIPLLHGGIETGALNRGFGGSAIASARMNLKVSGKLREPLLLAVERDHGRGAKIEQVVRLAVAARAHALGIAPCKKRTPSIGNSRGLGARRSLIVLHQPAEKYGRLIPPPVAVGKGRGGV